MTRRLVTRVTFPRAHASYLHQVFFHFVKKKEMQGAPVAASAQWIKHSTNWFTATNFYLWVRG